MQEQGRAIDEPLGGVGDRDHGCLRQRVEASPLGLGELDLDEPIIGSSRSTSSVVTSRSRSKASFRRLPTTSTARSNGLVAQRRERVARLDLLQLNVLAGGQQVRDLLVELGGVGDQRDPAARELGQSFQAGQGGLELAPGRSGSSTNTAAPDAQRLDARGRVADQRPPVDGGYRDAS